MYFNLFTNNELQAKFKQYLFDEGYREKTPSDNKSTIYDYIKRIDKVCRNEQIDWIMLSNKIDMYISMYDRSGVKEKDGNSSHRAVINALKAYRKFLRFFREYLEEDIYKSPYKQPIEDPTPSGLMIRRNPNLTKLAIGKANYRCELNPGHITFLNQSGLNYMEGHHLIPCTSENTKSIWCKFQRNIDCLENIISLCPNCHRAIHYGNETHQLELLERLYKMKNSELEKIGVIITLTELQSFYKSENDDGND